MANLPLFSIITISKNNAGGLSRTQQSIIQQTFINYEWIVIDGKSHDKTTHILTTIKPPHQWISETDTGLYDAMNKGIKKSNGTYLIFLNAGDTFVQAKTLQNIADAAQDRPDFLYGDSIESQHYKKARKENCIKYGMFTHHQSMIYKTEIVKKIKDYKLQYQIASDYDFTWRFLKRAKDIQYIQQPVCIFETGGISQKNVLNGRIEQFKIRRQHGIHLLNATAIFLIQTLFYQLRTFLPSIYWIIKRP